MKEQIEQLISKLQHNAFRKGQRYEKQCREGLSGDMSEYYAPAMHHEMQEVIGKIVGLIGQCMMQEEMESEERSQEVCSKGKWGDCNCMTTCERGLGR